MTVTKSIEGPTLVLNSNYFPVSLVLDESVHIVISDIVPDTPLIHVHAVGVVSALEVTVCVTSLVSVGMGYYYTIYTIQMYIILTYY